MKKIKARKIMNISVRAVIVFISLAMIQWYIASTYFAFGNIVGIAFFTLTALCAVFFDPLRSFVSKLRKKKSGRIAVDIVILLISCFLLYSAAALGLMAYGAKKAPEKGATVVLLGCQVRGRTPSHALKMRIDAAFRYLEDNPGAKAVLSGGKGSNEDISEAECMYECLTDMGISSDRLYIEDRSTTTNENIRFSKNIIEENGLDPRMAIVTDWYHEYRASMIADRQGIKSGAVSADVPMYLTAHLVTREIFALANEFIFKG